MAKGSIQAESPTDETGKRSAIVSAQGIPTAGVVCVLSGAVLVRGMASKVQASRLGAGEKWRFSGGIAPSSPGWANAAFGDEHEHKHEKYRYVETKRTGVISAGRQNLMGFREVPFPAKLLMFESDSI